MSQLTLEIRLVETIKSNWFTGAGPIDNQNGLESVNGDLKKTKTIRLKQKLGDFLSNALTMVEQFSHKDDTTPCFIFDVNGQ